MNLEDKSIKTQANSSAKKVPNSLPQTISKLWLARLAEEPGKKRRLDQRSPFHRDKALG